MGRSFHVSCQFTIRRLHGSSCEGAGYPAPSSLLIASAVPAAQASAAAIAALAGATCRARRRLAPAVRRVSAAAACPPFPLDWRRVPVGIGPPPGAPWAGDKRLLEDFQIGDDVIDILGIGHSAIRHAVALHLRLRVLDIGAQIIVVPNKVRAPHRIRVAEILKRPRLASEYALEARPQRVGPLRMARRAGLIERLAV